MDQPVIITIAVPTQTITSNGASPVTFKLDGFEATLTDVPLLGMIIVSDEMPPSTIDLHARKRHRQFPRGQPG